MECTTLKKAWKWIHHSCFIFLKKYKNVYIYFRPFHNVIYFSNFLYNDENRHIKKKFPSLIEQIYYCSLYFIMYAILLDKEFYF